MIDFAQVSIVIVLFIILLMILAKNPICNLGEKENENFDTYYNHDMGVHTVYQNKPYAYGNAADISIDDAELKANYRWSDKTPAGDNVYDQYYEELVQDKNSDYDPNYDYSQNSEDAYDMKFNNAPGSQGYDFDTSEGLPVVHREFEHKGLPSFGIDLAQKGWMNG